MSAVGMAEEFRGKVAFNCLWPRTAIATSAIEMLAGSDGLNASRTVDIMSDAAHWILTQDGSVSGNCFVDDDIITDADKLGHPASVLSDYRYNKWLPIPLIPDLYVGEPDSLEKFQNLAKFVTSGSYLKSQKSKSAVYSCSRVRGYRASKLQNQITDIVVTRRGIKPYNRSTAMTIKKTRMYKRGCIRASALVRDVCVPGCGCCAAGAGCVPRSRHSA
eukprot:6141043-Prymnesium_polylepis.1